jgi:hypothetical protein
MAAVFQRESDTRDAAADASLTCSNRAALLDCHLPPRQHDSSFWRLLIARGGL